MIVVIHKKLIRFEILKIDSRNWIEENTYHLILMIKDVEYYFGVECKQCLQKWKMKVIFENKKFQSTGAICQCGAIFAGMINTYKVKQLLNESSKAYHKPMGEKWIKETHLTNGSFVVMDINASSVNYPILESEI